MYIKKFSTRSNKKVLTLDNNPVKFNIDTFSYVLARALAFNVKCDVDFENRTIKYLGWYD